MIYMVHGKYRNSHLTSYDYADTICRDSTDRFIGPIVNAHTNLTEIDLTMDLFWRNKVRAPK